MDRHSRLRLFFMLSLCAASGFLAILGHPQASSAITWKQVAIGGLGVSVAVSVGIVVTATRNWRK